MAKQTSAEEILSSRWRVVEDCWGHFYYIKSAGGLTFIKVASSVVAVAEAIVEDHNKRLDGVDCSTATGGQMKTGMQKLRQRVADALAEVQASHPPAGDWEGPATPRGIQVGNIGAFEVVLEWIDEIVAESK